MISILRVKINNYGLLVQIPKVHHALRLERAAAHHRPG